MPRLPLVAAGSGILFSLALALAACPAPNNARPVPPGEAGSGWQPPAPPVVEAPPDAGAEVARLPAGSACTLDDDCESEVCEGVGCGEDEGRCAEAQRRCTRDLVAYCGCDGVTFQASGSCPGARFQARGACQP